MQQITRTDNLDSNLISRRNKLNLMADFMRTNYENSKLKQSEIANQLDYSSSTLQTHRKDKRKGFYCTKLTQKTPINEQKAFKN